MTWLAVQSADGFKYRKRSKIVSRVLIERYLRDDIPCGSLLCDSCPENSGALSASASHYMVPDAASLLDWMEVWELPDVTDVVLLASVMAEVQATLTQRKAKQLSSLFKDRRRHCSLFDNVHHRETSVPPPRPPPPPSRRGKRPPQLAGWQGSVARQGEHGAVAGGGLQRGSGGTWESAHSPVYSCGCVGKLPGGLQALLVAAAWFAQHIGCRVPVVILSDALVDVVESAHTGHGPGPAVAGARFSFCSDERNCALRGLVSSSADPTCPLQVCSSKSYFPAFWGHVAQVTDLVDSLRQARATLGATAGGDQGAAGSVGKDYLYREHLSVFACEAGISDGRLVQGVVHVSKGRFFVRPSHRDEASVRDILVPDAATQNRSMHGDVVAVRVLDSEHWQLAPSALAMAHEDSEVDTSAPDLSHGTDASSAGTRNNNSSTVGAPLAAATGVPPGGQGPGSATGADRGGSSSVAADAGVGNDKGMDRAKDRVPTGVVVGILQRHQGSIVACLSKADEDAAASTLEGRREAFLCVPFDRKLPKIRLCTRQVGRLVGHRFVMRMDRWDRDSQFPEGHLVHVLGPIGEPDIERSVVLLQHDIKTAPFSAGALAELPIQRNDEHWSVPASELGCRRDLRTSHRIMSIDPPGSTDVDDALSVHWLPNGLLELGVHIADVSFFVAQESLLDYEARARATTVYLIGQRFDMLPSVLSENLCSLLGHVDRLAVSVIWTVDPSRHFEVLDTWFGRTLIHSGHQLHYGQAQAIMDGAPLAPSDHLAEGPREEARVREDLKVLATFAEKRRSARLAAGALELISTELRFELDKDGLPTTMHTKEGIPMNEVIAEMMIFANSSVAEKIYRTFPRSALLRHHGAPRQDRFDLLQQLCEATGLKISTGSNKALAASLKQLQSHQFSRSIEVVLKTVATRALSEAQYFSTGSAPVEAFYHYGLAVDFYTHFTSPIRRYADVLVHRLLLDAIALTSATLEPGGGRGQLPPPTLPASPGRPYLDNNWLSEVADSINEKHRASKKAQKDCSELYLLLYVSRSAQVFVEEAIVMEVRSNGLIVFLPRFQIKGPAYLVDKGGEVMLPSMDPLVSGAEASKQQQLTQQQRQQQQGEGDQGDAGHPARHHVVFNQREICIVDASTSAVLHRYATMDRVWVHLHAEVPRAHSPTMKLRLLHPQHPDALRMARQQPPQQQQEKHPQQEQHQPQQQLPKGTTAAMGGRVHSEAVTETEAPALPGLWQIRDRMTEASTAATRGAPAAMGLFATKGRRMEHLDEGQRGGGGDQRSAPDGGAASICALVDEFSLMSLREPRPFFFAEDDEWDERMLGEGGGHALPGGADARGVDAVWDGGGSASTAGTSRDDAALPVCRLVTASDPISVGARWASREPPEDGAHGAGCQASGLGRKMRASRRRIIRFSTVPIRLCQAQSYTCRGRMGLRAVKVLS